MLMHLFIYYADLP